MSLYDLPRKNPRLANVCRLISEILTKYSENAFCLDEKQVKNINYFYKKMQKAQFCIERIKKCIDSGESYSRSSKPLHFYGEIKAVLDNKENVDEFMNKAITFLDLIKSQNIIKKSHIVWWADLFLKFSQAFREGALKSESEKIQVCI